MEYYQGILPCKTYPRTRLLNLDRRLSHEASEGAGVGERRLREADRSDLRDDGRTVRLLAGVGERTHFQGLGAEADGDHREEQRHVLVSDAESMHDPKVLSWLPEMSATSRRNISTGHSRKTWEKLYRGTPLMLDELSVWCASCTARRVPASSMTSLRSPSSSGTSTSSSTPCPASEPCRST